MSLNETKDQITSAIMKQRQLLHQHQTRYEEASEAYRQSDVKLKSLSGLRDLMIGADSIDKYLDSFEDGLPEYEGMLLRSFAMTEMIAIRGAQNNSAPYDLNLDLLEQCWDFGPIFRKWSEILTFPKNWSELGILFHEK